MRSALLKAHSSHTQLFFSKWDLQNFYWSLRGPWQFVFPATQVDQSLKFYGMSVLPFGWDKAPWLGQTLHSLHVNQIMKPGNIENSIYIDDGLSFGPSPDELRQYMKEVFEQLEENGYIMSPKSQPEPTISKEFIGKLYANCFISNTEARAARILMMTAIIVQAPYLSNTFLKKLMGSDVYAVCHHSSYACLGFLRYILAQGGYMKTDLKFRSSMCAVAATALKAWTGQGFIMDDRPQGPLIFIDGSSLMVGIVAFVPFCNEWIMESVPLPQWMMSRSVEKRQQLSELYAALAAIRFCLRHHINQYVLVMDNLGTLQTLIKGSTSFDLGRSKVLNKIQYLVNKKNLLVQVAYVASEWNPADYPSRVLFTFQSISGETLLRLQEIFRYPSIVNLQPLSTQQHVDCSHGAWSTPPEIRELIATSNYRPTLDLYADCSNALAMTYGTVLHPITVDRLHRDEICFFQPPYHLLERAWMQILPHLSQIVGLWGLVPKSFFDEFVYGSAHHICVLHAMIDYCHHEISSTSGAKFSSCLFFISPQKRLCVCSHISLF